MSCLPDLPLSWSINYLSFKPGLSVGRVKLDQPSIFSTSSNDGTILENADGEDGAVVDLAQGLRDGIVAAAPDEDVPVGVAGDDVTGETKGQAGHVLGLVALIEQTGLAWKGQTETKVI